MKNIHQCRSLYQYKMTYKWKLTSYVTEVSLRKRSFVSGYKLHQTVMFGNTYVSTETCMQIKYFLKNITEIHNPELEME